MPVGRPTAWLHQKPEDLCMLVYVVNDRLIGTECQYKKWTRRIGVHHLIIPYAGLNLSFGCLQRGHFQSSGSDSNAVPSCSAGS